jgi:hypothetical protein
MFMSTLWKCVDLENSFPANIERLYGAFCSFAFCNETQQISINVDVQMIQNEN